MKNMLVVDDEPDLERLILQKFRKKIRASEYSFIFAKNGEEALDIINNNDSINLILTDINMPGMDGLTLLSKLNELNNKALRYIIVSAYGDMENIRLAMNRGASDFITKPINLTDLEITIEKTLEEIEEYNISCFQRDKLISIKKELDIANAIQTSILPKVFPPFPERKDFDIYAKMLPAKEVGGDLYDFFLIDKYRLGVIIGDVTGKGIASALLMAVSKTLLKATAQKGIPTDQVMFEVNNMLVEESPTTMFATVFYGVLDTRNGAFEYTNGGHCPPYILSNGDVCQLDKVGGLLLGALKNAEYESDIIMLKPQDVVFFYTDGITEAFNTDEEEYDQTRLQKSLQSIKIRNVENIVYEVIEDVKNFSNGIEQSDDITCLAFKYNGNGK